MASVPLPGSVWRVAKGNWRGDAAVIHLALDVGEKRIGVAVSDETALLASPLMTIRRKSTASALEAVARVVVETGAELVVVGLPVSFDGQLHGQAKAIQSFAAKLRGRLAQPVTFADETLSSVRAEEALRAAGARPDRIRERLDAAAAAVILQDYLDARNRGEASRFTDLSHAVDGGDVAERSGDVVEE
jgi:putative Holliday junction resolvase